MRSQIPGWMWGTQEGPYAWAVLEPGSVAPEFSIPGHDGETVTLSQLRDRWVVLWFYPVADTPG